MDESITDTSAQDTGANALPDTSVDTSAANDQNQAQDQTQDTGADAALPDSQEEKLVKFAESHGISLDSESAIKAAKMAMDNQSAYQQAQSKQSQLEKSIQTQSSGDYNADALRDLQSKYAVMEFKNDTPDWKEYEPQMVEKLSEEVRTAYGVFPRSELVSAGLLTLQDVYLMAKATVPAQKQEDVGQVLQSIANKQRAGGISPNASNSAPPAAADPVLEAIKRARSES